MDEVQFGADLLPDIKPLRYSFKRKAEEVILSYNSDTYEVLCKNPKTEKVDCRISLFEVKEIRWNKNSKDFEKWATESKKIDGSKCFVIFYGTKFLLKTLSVAAPSRKEAENWVKGLEYLLEKRPTSYQAKLDVWLQQEYGKMIISTNQQSITLKQMRNFTNRINFNISTGKLKDSCFSVQTNNGALNIFGFTKLVREFLHDERIFMNCFGIYALGSRVDLNGFLQFLRLEQNEAQYSDYFHFFREYVTSTASCKGVAYMNSYEAVDFLFSKENQVWNPNCAQVYQDMTRPLSHYWIASSHNTYLTGYQISSTSSVEAYARCLRQGCRCVELDCWDGPDGYPVVYHGSSVTKLHNSHMPTLAVTTKVSFVDVIKTIRDHAFVTSEYPVILSIENHCSVKQQKVMAKKFEEVFGKKLVTTPIHRDETELPSPEKLKGRFILKCKKLPKHAKEIIEEFEKDGMEWNGTFKSGIMYKQEGCVWEPYYFALTNDKLIYTDIEEENYRGSCESINQSVNPVEELHYSEKWFHGKIQGGVKAAEELVRKFGVEGCFLVRQSDTYAGEYSLCFMSQGRVHHVRIKSNPDQTMFYLISNMQFDSVYSLISHYRTNPLSKGDFHIACFTTPVPIPEKHEEELWFYPNTRYPEPMDRKRAEEVLQRIPLNGAFLVRYSSDAGSGEGRFVISFRIENQIKHCRIKEDGRLLVVSCQRFENIEKLVQYYSARSFYKGVKLKHPVNEDLYNLAYSSDVQDDEKVYTSPDYLETNDTKPKKVRALLTNQQLDTDLLRFEKDDIITNVVKMDGVWWKGDLGEQIQKTFPAYFVEELEPDDSPFGESQKGSVVLGTAELEKGTDEQYPYILKINSSNPVPFRAALKSSLEAKDWQVAINYVNTRVVRKTPQSDKIQKKNKIAQEFSKQIIYCRAVSMPSPEELRKNGRKFNEMSSLSEVTAEKQMSLDPEFYVWYHQVQFSRIYPNYQRVNSSNYNPIRFWNFGCQMVALNYQTPDRPMQLNHGKFRDNGGCGYVLHPDFMFQKAFNPNRIRDLDENEIKPLTLKLTIIAARQLAQTGSPFVEVEIIGADFDCQKVRTTKTIGVHQCSNGFNPFWNEKFTIKVLNPHLALIRFSVSYEDSFGDSVLIGQATYPATCLRSGFRSVPLESGLGEELISSMLIHLEPSHEIQLKTKRERTNSERVGALLARMMVQTMAEPLDFVAVRRTCSAD